MSWARNTAWKVLITGEHTPKDPRELLDTAFNASSGIRDEERALASNLVFSVLRWRSGLDWVLNRVSRIPLSQCSAEVRTALRLGAVQILVLDRIPAHAAVNETVGLVKSSQPKWVTGFVNGVLRTVAREGRSLWSFPGDESDSPMSLAIAHSHPEWLVRRWMGRWSRARVLAVMDADNREPPRTVRVNRLRLDRVRMGALLNRRGVEVRETAFSPDGLMLDMAGPIDRLEAWATGEIDIQDEGAQLFGYLACPSPGMRVLELCAGRGGKTGHLAQLMMDRGEITAVDVEARKVRGLWDNMIRQRIRSVAPVRADAAALTREKLGGAFPLVVLDAPCTSLGVIRRRPDIRWNKSERDIARMAMLQRTLLTAAARLVEVGGTLVYGTCSTEPEENEENVAWFLQREREFRIHPAWEVFPASARSLCDAGGYLRCSPDLHNTDGFFGVRLRREG